MTVERTKHHSRYPRADELRPPEDDLGLAAGDPPEALVVEEEDEVAHAQPAVARHHAARLDVPHDRAAELVGERFQLEACRAKRGEGDGFPV